MSFSSSNIKRKKNLCVVVAIDGVAAAAIMYVPRKHLRYIKDDMKEKHLQEEHD